ncbi:tRNA (adenosine(37)-N6)-threonylcarbamoyltransferase complex transferase subunit TsaD [uncultured Tyzzerella sp.]|uniref:tRNA (adenosine(37)-N6)-threonylcarbamoyltransferase complex transferase subunit TsaD n=1 Tax=uncultured Tyzzerella sp. TaxID=2321398 RepID=UPI002942411D|nr:tRNA (adenosine(37)-N6)-threonylcarbamoyltransferase complex transferase subunit TsaD [uncultured Tyzzerella sp.]
MEDKQKDIIILAIESSCDETSIAVVKNGREVLSNVISSQIDTHRVFGGVVPEIASRKHIEVIDFVLDEALEQANICINDIDAIAVTYGPGLVGALLVGVSYAKSLAYTLKKPLVPVHHIEGHIYANYIDDKELQPPFISLVISGGHTHIVYVEDYGKFKIIGKTRDDACGEAFDKVARTIGLKYPGGPEIDKLAKLGDRHAIDFPRVMIDTDDYDFSFSGLKSAVLNFVNKSKMTNTPFKNEDLAASFQQALVDVLVFKSIKACKENKVKILALAGGVSANSFLRESMQSACNKENIKLCVPSLKLCTDNAAMIGCAGYYQYLKENFANLDLNAYPNLKLDGIV